MTQFVAVSGQVRFSCRSASEKLRQGLRPKRCTHSRIAERVAKEQTEKLAKVLDYYAGTTVPFDRIAQHTKLKPIKVVEEMKARGRLS
jgi:hypothetical protein